MQLSPPPEYPSYPPPADPPRIAPPPPPPPPLAELEAKLGPRPLGVLAALWLVVLGLSLLGAKVVQDEAERSERLAELGALQSGLAAWTGLSTQLGLGGVSEALDGLRADVNAPYLIWKQAAAAPGPKPAAPATPQLAAADGPIEQVSPAKRRVLVIGASSIQFAVGVRLERMMGGYYEGLAVKRFGKLATGLSRPDFMDWPQKLRRLAAEFHPDLVICNFGGNDAQPILQDNGKKARFPRKAWDAAYAAKVKEIIDIAREHGADTVMLGMPIMRSAKFSRKMRHLNKVMKAATEAAGGQYVDTWVMAATPAGKYRKKVSWYGKKGLMRTSDGVHYRLLGARYVVDHSMRQVERRFTLSPKGKGVAEHRWYRGPKGQRFGAVLYRPHAGQRWPAVVVFPPEAGRWDAWDKHPHRELQRLVQATGQAVLLPDPGQSEEAWAWFTGEVLPKLSKLSPVDAPLRAVAAGQGAARLLPLLGRKKLRFAAVSLQGAQPSKARVKAIRRLKKTRLRLGDSADLAGLRAALDAKGRTYTAAPADPWPAGLMAGTLWAMGLTEQPATP